MIRCSVGEKVNNSRAERHLEDAARETRGETTAAALLRQVEDNASAEILQTLVPMMADLGERALSLFEFVEQLSTDRQ